MRIVFFGSPQFAVPTLERLLSSSHSVVGVVTQPDRPRGRGQRVSVGPVKALALAHGVPVLQPERLKAPDFRERFSSLGADLGVVAAYGKILPADLLQAPRLGFVNVHASLLPRWRGAAPVEWAVMAGDGETGVTIMRVVPALDAGPMLAARARAIGPDETAEEVERDLSAMGAALLLEVLDRMRDGTVEEQAQDDRLATYAPRLTKEEGLIDWSLPAADIHNKVRGLHPWPHAYAFLGGHRYIILRTSPEEFLTAGGEPGTVLEADADRLTVATGRGALRLRELQAEGRRPMGTRQFLAGHAIRRGARFDAAAPAR